MPMRFTVLASGSSGNASLVQVDDFGLLLDAGLGPRQLARRLAAVGASWTDVQAVLLTHTHGDHWHDRTLAHLRRRKLLLYCHAEHQPDLLSCGAALAGLLDDGLVRTYDTDQDIELTPRLRCRPLPVPHDSGPTFGFRLEHASADLFGSPFALGYATDLGSWTPELATALADVDVLALEFNHDVDLQHASGRSFDLIRRILGERGHLSNVQAAALLGETMRRSTPGRLRHLVQLHLSRECNRPALARGAARAILGDADVKIHAARQDVPGPAVSSAPHSRASGRLRGSRPRRARALSAAQPWLPGIEALPPSESA
jgi:phosphoribosyl 1,2-cyclic phosphodiesterase